MAEGATEERTHWQIIHKKTAMSASTSTTHLFAITGTGMISQRSFLKGVFLLVSLRSVFGLRSGSEIY